MTRKIVEGRERKGVSEKLRADGRGWVEWCMMGQDLLSGTAIFKPYIQV